MLFGHSVTLVRVGLEFHNKSKQRICFINLNNTAFFLYLFSYSTFIAGIAQTGLVNAEKLRKSRDEKVRELSEQLSVSVGSLGDEKLSEQDVEDFEDVCKDYLSKQKQDLQELKVCLTITLDDVAI